MTDTLTYPVLAAVRHNRVRYAPDDPDHNTIDLAPGEARPLLMLKVIGEPVTPVQVNDVPADDVPAGDATGPVDAGPDEAGPDEAGDDEAGPDHDGPARAADALTKSGKRTAKAQKPD
ncbi:hypothetical protein [Pannonibacter sp. SL95]|uniref:hypothetical protein n=1 Tax=Pannonibacter sp. SL95 TaxID=2995153 RepID=UPI0022734E93|nr:hypothetical protein [Pannonibacter sp. SL95]MCY1704442.1 hypothetical protein [Pannonibacter sp. SL95]MCY1704529.1 hypothetical protein [Pannonibacter sp. SL95]MCY1707324.1 hypothetical protein [Pannonibacter sp. SL95]